MYGQKEQSLCAGIGKSGCAVMSLLYALYHMGRAGAGWSPTLVNKATLDAHDAGILDKEFEVQDWEHAIRFFSNGTCSYGGYLHVSELKSSPFNSGTRFMFGLVAEWEYPDGGPDRHFTCNLHQRPNIVLYDPVPCSRAVRDGTIRSYRLITSPTKL